MCVCTHKRISLSMSICIHVFKNHEFVLVFEFKSNASGFFPAISTFSTSKNSDFLLFSLFLLICPVSLLMFLISLISQARRHVPCLRLSTLVGVLLGPRVTGARCQWAPTAGSLHGTALFLSCPRLMSLLTVNLRQTASSTQALPKLGPTLIPLHQAEIRGDYMYVSFYS